MLTPLELNLRVCGRCLAKHGRQPGEACPKDERPVEEHVQSGACPIGRFPQTVPVGPVLPGIAVPFQQPDPEKWGPPLWREIHTRRDADQAFVDSITARLPCGECKSWFRSYLKEHPPRFDDWARWAWECHNAANAKLKKPEVTWDAASARWLTA